MVLITDCDLLSPALIKPRIKKYVDGFFSAYYDLALRYCLMMRPIHQDWGYAPFQNPQKHESEEEKKKEKKRYATYKRFL